MIYIRFFIVIYDWCMLSRSCDLLQPFLRTFFSSCDFFFLCVGWSDENLCSCKYLYINDISVVCIFYCLGTNLYQWFSHLTKKKKLKMVHRSEYCHVFIKWGCFIFKFFRCSLGEGEKKNRVQGKKIKKLEVGVNHNKVICIIEFLAPFYFPLM